jgi:hypothetical protein
MTAASPPTPGAPDARFGARALFAGAALLLVAVPVGLLLFLVEGRWAPLGRVDGSARDELHELALQQHAFVTALKVVSIIGSAWVYVPLFAAVAVWLARRHHPRLAWFVVVTVSGSALHLRGAWRVVAIASAVAYVLAVGFARVGLGVHYVSDVLAGYALGAAWVAAMVAAFNVWREERGRPPADPAEGLEPGLTGPASP